MDNTKRTHDMNKAYENGRAEGLGVSFRWISAQFVFDLGSGGLQKGGDRRNGFFHSVLHVFGFFFAGKQAKQFFP